MLLLTPKTGRQVRHDIADYARRSADRTSQIPKAVKAASGAAKDAFSESMTDGPNLPERGLTSRPSGMSSAIPCGERHGAFRLSPSRTFCSWRCAAQRIEMMRCILHCDGMPAGF